MRGKSIAMPMSRKRVRLYARKVRRLVGCENQLEFPIVEFLEKTLPELDEDFTLEILEASEMGECHGKTYPDAHKIQLREDVYNNAVTGKGRDRLTVAHEIAHYLLHENCNVALARADSNIPAYKDPEWQATAFGGELLVPAHLVQGMTPEEVAYKCGVSLAAAKYQLKKQRR